MKPVARTMWGVFTLLVGVLIVGLATNRSAGYRTPSAELGANVVPSITPSASPMATATWIKGPAFAECLWSHDIRAFVDLNTNGQWDKGEPPLSGVEAHVDDTLNQFTDVGHGTEDFVAITDSTGTTTLLVRLPGCPEHHFVVYSKAPAGYTLTTPDRVNAEIIDDNTPILFGFRQLGVMPGMPRTGRPATEIAP